MLRHQALALRLYFATLFLTLTAHAGSPACSERVAGAPSVLQRAVVVVDAYSSAHRYGPELRRRGFGADQGGGPLIHVHSMKDVPPVLLAKFRPQDWDVQLTFTNREETLAQLRRYDIAAVFVGTETGVNVADELSEALGVRTNGTALSEARRNKYLMAETIRAKGLRAVKQVKATTLEEVLAFAESHGEWPIVLKPLASAATDGVTICRTRSDLVTAFEKVMGKRNALGGTNSEVLVQEFLDGDEYIFDVVARDGKFVVTDMWRYHKRDLARPDGVFRVYDRDELLPYDGEVQRQLIEYGIPVLQALGNLNGPSHMEVMMTRRGPVLVEVGARLAGTDIPGVVSECTGGRSQVELTVDAYLFPERFEREVGKPYVLHKHGLNVDLISDGGTVLPGFREALRELPSYLRDSFHFEPGEALPVTKDLFTSPGTVFLVHPDPAQLERDSRRVDELKARFFR